MRRRKRKRKKERVREMLINIKVQYGKRRQVLLRETALFNFVWQHDKI